MKLLLFVTLALLTFGCWDSNDQGDLNVQDSDEPTDSSPTETDNDSDSDSGEGTATDEDDTGPLNEAELEWKMANLTWYESYPDPGSAECIEYNGCTWEGLFAGLNGKMSLEWVQANNIAAVHSDHFAQYNGKTLRVRFGEELQIDVVVYDMCADSDCGGCCTDNMFATGFLIDMEIHTAERFGKNSGIVEFACLDCE